jgi:hypothetical protein
MGITYLKRIDGATNSLIQMDTSDSTALVVASNYITTQLANITAVNEGGWTWEPNDLIIVSASDGVSLATINSTFTTLNVLVSELFPSALTVVSGIIAHPGGGQALATLLPAEFNNVTIVAAAGNSVLLPPSFLGAQVIVANSGVNPMQVFGTGTDTINGVAAATGVSQAAGTVVVYRVAVAGNWITSVITKGTGTVVTNAVTINAPVGVITTGALTTASGANATAITLTNSFITASSAIFLQDMGGTNTTRGVTYSVVPGAGTASITITNGNVAAAALNGTVIFAFQIQ